MMNFHDSAIAAIRFMYPSSILNEQATCVCLRIFVAISVGYDGHTFCLLFMVICFACYDPWGPIVSLMRK